MFKLYSTHFQELLFDFHGGCLFNYMKRKKKDLTLFFWLHWSHLYKVRSDFFCGDDMERNSETPRVVPFVFKGLLVLHWDLEVQERDP